jgi:hypothetical protein
MEIPSTLLVIAGFIIVLLGIGAGMLLSSLSEETEPEGEGADEAPPGGAKGRYAPVARLWRERGARALVVEVEGKAFLSPDALDPAQRERLEAAARDLRAWLGLGLANSSPPDASPAPIPPSTDPAAPAAPPVGSASAAAAAVAAAAAAVPASAAVRPLSPEAESTSAESAAPWSIVGQIDDILQDMLAGGPLEHRAIRLIEDPDRGVIVKVGLQYFEGIDAVPDPEIQSVIRAAVSAWEKTQ